MGNLAPGKSRPHRRLLSDFSQPWFYSITFFPFSKFQASTKCTLNNYSMNVVKHSDSSLLVQRLAEQNSLSGSKRKFMYLFDSFRIIQLVNTSSLGGFQPFLGFNYKHYFILIYIPDTEFQTCSFKSVLDIFPWNISYTS